MTTFTINEQNEIVAFSNQEEAAAATTTPFDTFSSQKELADLAGAWPPERLVAILNSLAGEKPVKKVKDPKTAASRIWARIQGLGDAAQPEPEAAKPEVSPAKPKADKKAKGRAQGAKGAPATGLCTSAVEQRRTSGGNRRNTAFFRPWQCFSEWICVVRAA